MGVVGRGMLGFLAWDLLEEGRAARGFFFLGRGIWWQGMVMRAGKVLLGGGSSEGSFLHEEIQGLCMERGDGDVETWRIVLESPAFFFFILHVLSSSFSRKGKKEVRRNFVNSEHPSVLGGRISKSVLLLESSGSN